MNVFFLDVDPRLAAQAHVNTHTNGMIKEAAQMLSAAHILCPETEPDPALYKLTHQHHPSTRWVRQSAANYWWTYRLMLEIGREYTYRYWRTHATITRLADVLRHIPVSIYEAHGGNPNWTPSPPPPAMDDEFKLYPTPRTLEESVANYRNYYKHGKADLHRWTRRSPPEWIK